MKLLLCSTVLAAVTAIVIPIPSSFAQGSLMVNPKRILLSDRHRTDNITLFNSSDDTASFVISLLHYSMRPDGSFEQIPDSISTYSASYCDSIIRYFPLEVELGPHESQAVRVRFMKPENLAPGEYRSHMYFRAIEKAKALEETAHDTSQHTISLQLRPIFGLSIPIIVRYQTTAATVTLDSGFVTMPDTGGHGLVTANLNRSGNESCYGSLIVFFKDKDGHESQVGILKGVAVYTGLATRKISLGYALAKNQDANTGTFRLEYQTLTDNPKEMVLASAGLTALK